MRVPVALAALSLTLAGCTQPPTLHADDGWVRLPAVPGQPAAAYFTVHGGPTPATLIDVSADTAIGAAMHRSMAAAGAGPAVMTMTPIARLPIPAKGIVRFAPGGLHVMLSELNPSVKRGGTMRLTLSFADGTRIVQDATVVAAGDPAPTPA